MFLYSYKLVGFYDTRVGFSYTGISKRILDFRFGIENLHPSSTGAAETPSVPAKRFDTNRIALYAVCRKMPHMPL
jgi:hypothetical protein